MRVYLGSIILFLLSLLGAEVVCAHTGYLHDVTEERETRFYEIFLFSTPPPKKADLQAVIFNPALSKEFRDKYRERFGQIDTESIIYQPTNFTILDENRGASLQVEQDQDKRHAFGDYMVKRLVEWHLDNYFKTDPTMRPVYLLKEKLSTVQVEVTPTSKLNVRYNLSDNTADLVLENPYCESKVSLLMDPKQFGPGPLNDEKLVVEKQLTKKIRLNTSATGMDGIGRAEVIRSLRANWSTNFITTAAFKPGGVSPRESRYIIGLSHAY
jgi:hypothetical protein